MSIEMLLQHIKLSVKIELDGTEEQNTELGRFHDNPFWEHHAKELHGKIM